MQRNPTRSLAVLGALVLACLGVSAIAGAWTASSVSTWYPTLDKPSWTPPDWVFTPVWITLYIMMGVAAWLVWRKSGFDGARGPLALFALQLALNLAWSGLFFSLRSPLAGLVDIVLLLLALTATVFAFAAHSRLAAALLVPYLAWVSYATSLNAGIWWLNR